MQWQNAMRVTGKEARATELEQRLRNAEDTIEELEANDDVAAASQVFASFMTMSQEERVSLIKPLLDGVRQRLSGMLLVHAGSTC